jgi:hypothetical protein
VKVLFAINPNRPNSVTDNFLRGLKEAGQAVHSSFATFWKDETSQYDIIHIQWPESLLRWKEPKVQDLAALDKRLSDWKIRGSKIIVTRHNYLPHTYFSLNDKLYQTVYQRADGIIHFSDFSQQEFRQRYPSLTDCEHAIIPHPLYSDLKNNIKSSAARKLLGLSDKDRVFLVFGNIRLMEEQNMVIQSFLDCQLEDKKLVFSNGILTEISRDSIRRYPFKYVRRVLDRLFNYNYLKFKKITIKDQFVPSEEIQNFLNASDVLIIQRINQLNSGNIPLGFTFGKVVIGPGTGNIGEILQQTGNPVFDPSDYNSIRDAMMKGMELARMGHGNKNRAWAEEHCSFKEVGKKHLAFYQQLANAKIKQ